VFVVLPPAPSAPPPTNVTAPLPRVAHLRACAPTAIFLLRRRFLYNKDYSDAIWEPSSMNGAWRWNPGSLIDPGFMLNKKSFGRPPPQVLASTVPATII